MNGLVYLCLFAPPAPSRQGRVVCIYPGIAHSILPHLYLSHTQSGDHCMSCGIKYLILSLPLVVSLVLEGDFRQAMISITLPILLVALL